MEIKENKSTTYPRGYCVQDWIFEISINIRHKKETPEFACFLFYTAVPESLTLRKILRSSDG